jgi:YfiR/HmsC-like
MKGLLHGFAIVMIVGLSSFSYAPAPEPDVNAKTKTLFIYNFTKYVEWPTEMKVGTFIIGFYGDYPNLLQELQNMAETKTAGSQKIEIVNYTNVNAIGKCHILFVNEDKGQELAAIVKKTAHRPTLIVTDNEGLAAKGSCINFYYESSKQRMEINPETISKRDLKVSGQLLGLAKVIR